MKIDRDRLKLILKGDVLEECWPDFDFDQIIASAYESDGKIIVKSHAFMFIYDAVTYTQIHGSGGG